MQMKGVGATASHEPPWQGSSFLWEAQPNVHLPHQVLTIMHFKVCGFVSCCIREQSLISCRRVPGGCQRCSHLRC